MPKRRMTAARRRQIALWQSKSYTSPVSKRARLAHQVRTGALGHTPPGFGGRRTKQGGKAYQHKAGKSSFKPASEASAILAGTKSFRNPAVSAMESRAAMGAGPRVPKPEWYARPKPVHGSGTGLTSAYRYLPKKGR